MKLVGKISIFFFSQNRKAVWKKCQCGWTRVRFWFESNIRMRQVKFYNIWLSFSFEPNRNRTWVYRFGDRRDLTRLTTRPRRDKSNLSDLVSRVFPTEIITINLLEEFRFFFFPHLRHFLLRRNKQFNFFVLIFILLFLQRSNCFSKKEVYSCIIYIWRRLWRETYSVS